MGLFGGLTGRGRKRTIALVMSWRNHTGAPLRLTLEPLGRTYEVAPNRTAEIFDLSPPDDPFMQVDDRGDAVTIYRWMTRELVVKVEGAELPPIG